MSIALLLLVAVAALAWTVVPLLRAEEEPVPVAPGDGTRDRLADRKDALYESIRDLDFEFAQGKLIEADYQAARAEMMHDAAGLLQQLDAVAPDEALDRWIEDEIRRRREGRPDSAKCPACGRANPGHAQFCDGCGGKFAAPTCSGCAAPLRADARFCNACGRKV